MVWYAQNRDLLLAMHLYLTVAEARVFTDYSIVLNTDKFVQLYTHISTNIVDSDRGYIWFQYCNTQKLLAWIELY